MIILNILKIIGIILASILGILLLMFLVVLFCPIRYHVFGTEFYNNEGNHSNIIVKVSWLLHLIGLDVSINSNISVYLRVLFFKKRLDGKKNADIEKSATNDSGTDASENSEIVNNEYTDEENVYSKNINNINNSEAASKNFLRHDAEALRFFRTRGTFFGGRNSEGDGYSYRRQKHLRQI